MALQKTAEEIERMAAGGLLLSQALFAAVSLAKPGASVRELDDAAETSLRQNGATPSFKGYRSYPDDRPFPSTVCASLNEEVVHGSGRRSRCLKEGDVVSLDIGCWYEGLCTDMAVTVAIGQVSQEINDLILATRAALLAGVGAVKAGGEVKDISASVENTIRPYGYGIVRALVGHGVGHAVHENPHIPNFVDRHAPNIRLIEGMCLAIEPMIVLGKYHVVTSDDGWTVQTADGKSAAHFEVTVAVTKEGSRILTPLPV
ncbi:MAG TPA: type I methionyl aminopeptidase [Patescibacteria group bacterium]|nr:type I methionyl aminopeptidase [Patescibacteria group bacterium]